MLMRDLCTPWWAGTRRMETSLSLDRTLVQAPVAAMAKRWPGPMLSDLILSMADVESTNTVIHKPCKSDREEAIQRALAK